MNPIPPVIFDNSMRCSFLECPRKFYFWFEGYDYAQIPTYFAFGQAWGLIKQTWYESKGHRTEPASPEWKEKATSALKAGFSLWMDIGLEGATKPNDPETLSELWHKYLEMYPNEDLDLIAAEVGFMFPLGIINGLEVFVGGALDGYANWPDLGVLALEDKTTGMYLGDSYIASYSYSPQITTYCWQGRKTIGDEFHGVLVNMASKRITKAGKTPQFTRSFQTRNETDYEEFERDFTQFIEDLYKAYDENYFRKTANPINCVGGIGKSPCLFRGICVSGIPYQEVNPLTFPNIIKKEDWTWEPWKRGQKEAEE